MSTAEALALIASFVGGLIFMVLAVLPIRRPAAPPAATVEKDADLQIYWPLLLGTGEKDVAPDLRLEIARELMRRGDDWSLAILRCARDQETDPRTLEVIERGLEQIAKPILGPPPGWRT